MKYHFVRRCHASLAHRLVFVVGFVVALGGLASAVEEQLIPEVVVDGEPVGPWPVDPKDGTQITGPGLCGAFKYIPNNMGQANACFGQRTSAFPNDAAIFPQTVNDFMDGKTCGLGAGARYDENLLSTFDLSNQFNLSGLEASGDYTGTPGCPNFGCNFPGAAASGAPLTEGFGTRYRGFFNVPPNLAGQIIHFGFSTDNAVAMYIYAMPKAPIPPAPAATDSLKYLVLSRGWDANPQLRLTNGVTFLKSGIYPIEIVHAQNGAAAVLEFAVFYSNDSNYEDIDQYNNGQPKLNQLNYQLLTPNNFFQTANGFLSFPSPKCQQCPREYAKPSVRPLPAGTCDSGFFCNAAALCEYCPFATDAKLCTPNCVHCMKPAAICWHHVPNGAPEDSECVECLTEKDCELGFSCTDHKCVPRRPPAIACPGANYFGVGSNLEPTSDCQQFAAISPCSKDADCPTPQVCDIANTRCIDQLPECRFDDKCGKDCIDCKNAGGTGRARPHCLNGQVCVECRIDTDCALGSYCVSGDCVPCTDDRHCGQGCANCSLRVGADCTPTLTETPFCYSPNGQASGSVCVACMKDADCGAGNTCDTALHTCTYADPESLPACPPNLVRKGKDCVQCVSSSQCLCGSCDQGTNSCVEICNDNTDCQGNQCCTRGPDGIRKCLPGRCAGTAGGALCGCSVSALSHPVVDNNTIHPDGFDASRSRGALLGLLSMALFALVFRRRQLLWEARQGGPR